MGQTGSEHECIARLKFYAMHLDSLGIPIAWAVGPKRQRALDEADRQLDHRLAHETREGSWFTHPSDSREGLHTCYRGEVRGGRR